MGGGAREVSHKADPYSRGGAPGSPNHIHSRWGTGAQACPWGDNAGGCEGRRTGKGRLGADFYDTEIISRNKQGCFVVALQDRENAWASPAGWMCSGQGGGRPPEPAIQRGDEGKAVMRFLAKA